MHNIGVWYFEWGYLITTILAFPLGLWAGKHGVKGLVFCISTLLFIGLTMLFFKYH